MLSKRVGIFFGYVGLAIVSAVASFFIGLRFTPYSAPAVEFIESLNLPNASDKPLPESPVYSSGFYDQAFFDRAYERAGNQGIVASHSGIVAHHLLAAPDIAGVFARLSTDESVPVVLISPNHFDSGKSVIQTSFGQFATPYGVLEPDTRVIMRLLEEAPFLKAEEPTFIGEHGIFGITPFAKKSFPNGKVVPIVLHSSITDEQINQLVQAISVIIPDARVIASVDMSHNLPLYVSQFHDQVTMQEITNNGSCLEEVCDIDLEVDSNPSLKALFAWNALQGTEIWHLTHHGASLDISPRKDDWLENTSHILGYFTEGKVKTEDYATFWVGGDIMLDRGVRAKIDENGVEYPWLNMERFMMGVHRTVANLEGTISEEPAVHTPHDPPYDFVFERLAAKQLVNRFSAVSLANNHTRDFGHAGEDETRRQLTEWGLPWFGSWYSPIEPWSTQIGDRTFTWIGYHQFSPNIEELKTQIKTAKDNGNFVIVFPHWGTEYRPDPDSNQIALAKIMAESGADLIIGGHPHVPQGVSKIEGVPVVWSLGNFIFDQRLPETFVASTLGVIIKENQIEIHLLPVSVKDGQPTPISDTEAAKLFNHLANHSDPELATQVRTGVINLTY